MEACQDARVEAVLHGLISLGIESYLIGGAVRDFMLGKSLSPDLDLAVKGDGIQAARNVIETARQRATVIPLDATHGTSRVVLHGSPPVTLDFSPFKGDTICDDLRKRDFTINALALSTRDIFAGISRSDVIDPTGGLGDLAEKRVRACSGDAFLDDPLRIVRAFRFSASLGFEISPDTLAMIPPSLKGLSAISIERIRDELVAILSCERSEPALAAMDTAGVVDAIFPEFRAMKGCPQNYYHHLDVWAHTLETVRNLESLLKGDLDRFGAFAGTVYSYVNEEPVKGRPRRWLLKMAALFHDAGKPASLSVDPDGRIRFFGHEKISTAIFETSGARLKLASREIRTVAEWISGHMRPGILTADSVSRRAVLKLRRRFERDLIGLLLLFLADLEATRGPARHPGQQARAWSGVLTALEFCAELEHQPRERLLSGRDLIDEFGLKEGPYLGMILARLAELQDAGDVTTRSEAVSEVKEILRRDGVSPPDR